jgi:hypothetical protein
MGAKGRQTGTLTLARYTDGRGRPHRIVQPGRLVLALARREPPRVVALLGEGEGVPQARALLDGSAIDEATWPAPRARRGRSCVRCVPRSLRPGPLRTTQTAKPRTWRTSRRWRHERPPGDRSARWPSSAEPVGRSGDREEGNAGLTGDRAGQQRLAGAGRALQQDTLGDAGAERLELLRVPRNSLIS